jgi:phage shock protein C
MSTKQMESTVKITEKELQSTLHDFLEENEKEPAKNVWNLSTLSGLGFVFIAFAYIGHSIATGIFELQSLPFIYTIMKFMPYLAGALLGINILSMFKSTGDKRKIKEKEEQVRVKETYDKLDEFLYSGDEKTTTGKRKRAKKYESFNISSSTQKLFRSRTDKYIAGVCGGLSKYLGISSTVIRLIFLATLFLGYGSFFLVYIAMAIVMPKEPISLMDDFN